MSDKLTDHAIASLYQQGANEQPSKALDDKIQQLAKISAEQASNNNVTNIKKVRFYKTWYGQLSTAASLVLVAVLYVQNSGQYNHVPLNSHDEIMLDIQHSDEANFVPQRAAPMQQSEQIERIEITPLGAQKIQRNAVQANQRKEADSKDQIREAAYSQIDKLLAAGKHAEAKKALSALLAAQPALKQQLPERFNTLLTQRGDN
jgi:hypothetical protein